MSRLKAFLWRLVYVVIVVAILAFVIPLVFEMLGIGFPSGPALTLLKFALACLVLIYLCFGDVPPYTPF
jgi:hypothetical protein